MIRRIPRMSGRDINEGHRVSTPLELLFDLSFATAFAVVGQQLSRSLSQGSVFAALVAFGISMAAICWAWMSYSWFASAYDTDDWTFRSATMVHMLGPKIDGRWLFAERLLYVDWIEERALS